MFTWLLKLLADYLRLALFASGVVLGMQVPAFLEQYEQRVNASLLEAQQNLAGFQFTADRYFDGDLQRLIAHYSSSDDPVFNQDAKSIESIYVRVQLLRTEAQALAQSPVQRALHVAFDANQSLRQEAIQHFSFSVPLTTMALIWGAVLAFALAIVLDSCVACGKYCKQKIFHRPHRHDAAGG